MKYNEKVKPILRRKGNKNAISDKIIEYFPRHDLFIDMFFGAGGIFFNKPKAKYNICNDNDENVYNLHVLLQKEETKNKLYEEIKKLILHQKLYTEWNKQPFCKDIIKQTAKFLLFVNASLMAYGSTICYGNNNVKQIILDRIENIYNFIQDIQFMCCNFRDVLKSIQNYKEHLFLPFVYADPPYLDTHKCYKSHAIWRKDDAADLFDILINHGANFAISEFDHPFILELAKKHNLNVNIIGERNNILNRRTEILITNFDKPKIENNLFS